jgi:hypothetical protein
MEGFFDEIFDWLPLLLLVVVVSPPKQLSAPRTLALEKLS